MNLEFLSFALCQCFPPPCNDGFYVSTALYFSSLIRPVDELVNERRGAKKGGGAGEGARASEAKR